MNNREQVPGQILPKNPIWAITPSCGKGDKLRSTLLVFKVFINPDKKCSNTNLLLWVNSFGCANPNKLSKNPTFGLLLIFTKEAYWSNRMTVLDPSGHLQNSYPSGKGSILISHHYDFPPKNNGKFNSQTILVLRRDRRSFFQDTIFLKNISYIAGEV